MLETAIKSIEEIIDVSEMLLQLLDTSAVAALASQASKNVDSSLESDQEAIMAKLIALMAEREEKVYHLFEHFNQQELQAYSSQLQIMSTLDQQLVLKVNSAQKSAKSKILTLKKNKKAISHYQKL